MLLKVIKELPEGGKRLQAATESLLKLSAASKPSAATMTRIKKRLLTAGVKVCLFCQTVSLSYRRRMA